jgi:hypothetical protein
MKELNYSSSGQILSVGKSSIELLSGIPVTGIVCEYAEDFIIEQLHCCSKEQRTRPAGSCI